MASNTPMVNGDIPLGAPYSPGVGGQSFSHEVTLEDTIQQMKVLIKENSDLKVALRRTNMSMKERFEGLTVWKEKQKDERDFLEGKLEEARERVNQLSKRNDQLWKKLQLQEASAKGGDQSVDSSEVELMKSVIKKLQAEKSDLVALNSELQLKAGMGSPGDSFIQIEEVDVNVEKTSQNEPSPSAVPIPDSPMPHWKSEELTVSQLLQALRKETDRGDKLELQLQATTERILELEQQTANHVERETQTSLETRERECLKPRLSQSLQEGPGKEVDTLLKELQMVRDTLQRTESTKRTLVDRYQAMEQNLATLENQLMEKEKVLAENQRLKVELESSHNATKMEQKRTEDEKKNKLQLQEAYTRLNEENQRMKEEMKQMPAISREEVSVLQERLDSAENALATKQKKIDEMKQEFFRNDKELEKISVLEAQAEVYKLDFLAEREAREKIHEEKERLAEQLEILRIQHSQLEEKIGRQSLGEIQRRCLTGRGLSGPPAHPQPGARGSLQIPEHACPKCNEVMPDLDSLQIHIMDCID